MKEYIDGVVQIGDAISSLSPKAQWVCYENDIDRIEWTDDSIPQPSNAEIEAEVKRLQAEYDASDWKRSRQAEYPSIEELVVALYDTDDKADIEAKRAEVKKKYPKPE